MSKYVVTWNADARTLVLNAGDTKSEEQVGFLVYGELGDIPDSASHPQVDQHLRNLAVMQGVDDYAMVTVQNETGNERLDKFAKEGDKERIKAFDEAEDAKVLDKLDDTDAAKEKRAKNANNSDTKSVEGQDGVVPAKGAATKTEAVKGDDRKG